MKARTVEARVVTIVVAGNRVVHISRFTDPTNGRDVLTISEGWQEDGPMPGPRGETLELPGAILGELVEGLRELDEPTQMED